VVVVVVFGVQQALTLMVELEELVVAELVDQVQILLE
tara:strand:+ start:599 stop:709 length:111 start_codon:yes stop_codon:yes gene_type:complete